MSDHEPALFRTITRATLFVVELRPHYFWRLPTGSRVWELRYQPESPVTQRAGEIYCCAHDHRGRAWRGWLPATVQWSAPRPDSTLYLAPMPKRKINLSAWDQVREDIVNTPAFGGYDKRGDPVDPWHALQWLAYFGPARRAQLLRVIREFGDTAFKAIHNTDQVIHRALSHILQEKITMSTITESRTQTTESITRKAEAAKAAAAAKKAKKAKKVKTPREPKRQMARTVGTKIVELCRKAKIKIFPIASKMEDGEATSAKELSTLRDQINEAAEKLRSKKGGASIASELSSQNRLVRRLQRAAKKAKA